MKLKETEILATLTTMFIAVGSAYATDLAVPHIFSLGTTAKSSEVNENFSYLADRSLAKSTSNTAGLNYSSDRDDQTGIQIINMGTGINRGSRLDIQTDAAAMGPRAVVSAYPGDYTYAPLAGWANFSSIGAVGLQLETSDAAPMRFNTNRVERIRLTTGGNLGIGTTSPSYPLHMGSGAYVTSGGVWTNASSREYKQNISNLPLESAQVALEKMNPVTFAYKNEPGEIHVGFIAEDVPDLVATKDRRGLSPMDTLAVVTKVVQDQQKTIKAQNEEIQALKSLLRQTVAGLVAVQQQVNHLSTTNQQPIMSSVVYVVPGCNLLFFNKYKLLRLFLLNEDLVGTL